ncbi:MAG: LPS export ABC transporter permease LptF [Candidatus Thioglobus sp.]|nr:MAG: LPS export ABC transporter permease LptF [Candidatus Thioglobus sp.]KAA0456410.1 MAG: LPS export ABC transporter permease LptF [Candidatus Thioglobus sp.]
MNIFWINPTFNKIRHLTKTTIAKYLVRDVRIILGAIFAIVSLIIFGNQVALTVKKTLEYNIPNADLFPLIAFNILRDTPLILSLSLFLAIILAISKLYKNSEAVVMNSLGIGDKHFMLMINPVVVPVVFFILLLSTLVVPWTKQEKNLIIHRNSNALEFLIIKQKEFQKFKNGNIVFYANKVEYGDKQQQIMHDVFTYESDGETIITLAEKVQKYTDLDKGSTYLHFENGARYYGFPGDYDKRILHFDEYDLQISDDENRPAQINYIETEAKSMLDLFASNKTKDAAEWQWRLSQPLSAFILSFLGVLLGKSSFRGGKNLGVLFGVAIFVLYNNALTIAKSALERGESPIWLGLWWVHLSMFLLIFILYAYRHKKFRILKNIFGKMGKF